MVFVSNEVGEHSITTRDLSVNENTIIQFEVLVFRKLLGLSLRQFCSFRSCSLVYSPSCYDRREACLISHVIALIIVSLTWVYHETFNTQRREVSATVFYYLA